MPNRNLLNLGSGQRKFGTGWTNVDINPRWEPDVVADCSSLPMFEDNSATTIVLHHTLEHYGLGEGDSMLKECHRILAPNGSVLVFVPNMPRLVEAWREGKITDQIFFTNVYGAYMGDEADRHKWAFTEQTLKDTLYRMGFRVLSFDWRTIPGADIAKDWWILAVEGVKT